MENSQMPNASKTLVPVMDLFKKSFDNYQRKIWLLVLLVLFGCVGFLTLFPLGVIAFAISFQSFNNNDFSPILVLADVLLALVGIFFVVLFELCAKVAVYIAIKEDNIDARGALSMAWNKIGSFFWISLLTGLAVIAGFILLVIPGIIFSVWFSFAIYVLISENVKGTDALSKSKQLVLGNWWPVFGRILIMMIIVILISWIRFLGPIINVFFVAPFSLVYLFLLYE